MTHADYMNAKCVCKGFEIKNLGRYRDFYVKSDTMLLADVVESFKKICLKLHHLDSVNFLQAPGLTWKTTLKV